MRKSAFVSLFIAVLCISTPYANQTQNLGLLTAKLDSLTKSLEELKEQMRALQNQVDSLKANDEPMIKVPDTSGYKLRKVTPKQVDTKFEVHP